MRFFSLIAGNSLVIFRSLVWERWRKVSAELAVALGNAVQRFCRFGRFCPFSLPVNDAGLLFKKEMKKKRRICSFIGKMVEYVHLFFLTSLFDYPPSYYPFPTPLPPNGPPLLPLPQHPRAHLLLLPPTSPSAYLPSPSGCSLLPALDLIHGDLRCYSEGPEISGKSPVIDHCFGLSEKEA